VLVAEPLDDFGPRRHDVSDRSTTDALLEPLDDFDGKTLWERGERSIENDPHHLPMARDRVFSSRGLGHATERRPPIVAIAIAEVDHATQTKRSEVRNTERDLPGDVAEGVAALITVSGGVRQLAAADAVEHDQDDTRKRSQVSDVSIVAMACLNAR
jgi:hypothetical protein